MQKQRLEWLDALRGFTMLMVVTNHVYGFGFDANTKYSMFMSVCLLFRMPLFFFISGFLAYKASFSWNARDTTDLIAKKLRVQIVPTVVFMTAEIALTAKVFWDKMGTAWASPTKGGYWFTMVLLEMFLIYYAVCWIGKRLTSRKAPDSPTALPCREEAVIFAAEEDSKSGQVTAPSLQGRAGGEGQSRSSLLVADAAFVGLQMVLPTAHRHCFRWGWRLSQVAQPALAVGQPAAHIVDVRTGYDHRGLLPPLLTMVHQGNAHWLYTPIHRGAHARRLPYSLFLPSQVARCRRLVPCPSSELRS